MELEFSPYIKGLSEQYRHTLAKYRVRVLFNGTSTIKYLLMHPKDPIPDAQKTDIIYHWKCPANNCTAEYIVESNRSLKERVSDHRNQPTSAIRNHHISTKHPKAECKCYSGVVHCPKVHWGNLTSHLCWAWLAGSGWEWEHMQGLIMSERSHF